MATDNVSPIRAGTDGAPPAEPPPSMAELAQRLERQRDRVLSAHGICVLATRLAQRAENDGGMDVDDALVLRSALEGLGEQLARIKHSISPESILAADYDEDVIP